jgi:mucolipin 3
MGDVEICISQYSKGTIFGFNESYSFDPRINVMCGLITESDVDDGVQSYLQRRNMTIQFSALVKATLRFDIKTVNLKASGPMSAPDCYKFKIKITFDNSDHDGQVIMDLDATAVRLVCNGKKIIKIQI